jgi:hypothetical protein
VYEQAHHSDEGVDQATYRFSQPGKYVIKVIINDILFNPVIPDLAVFNVTATK